MTRMEQKIFTPYRAFDAEGARLGLCSCMLCGAAIVIDSSDGITADQVHEQWHRARGDLKKSRKRK